MRVTSCPNCGEVVQGRDCLECGINVEEADATTCTKCGQLELEDKISRIRIYNPGRTIIRLCRECQD